MAHDDFDGGELVRPLASIVAEDQRTRAVLDIVGGVAGGCDNAVRDDAAVGVERGQVLWAGRCFGWRAGRVRSPGCAGELQRTYAVIFVANAIVTGNECLTMV